nr:hypothetical protein [Arthrobacter sp. MI7-26]
MYSKLIHLTASSTVGRTFVSKLVMQWQHRDRARLREAKVGRRNLVPRTHLAVELLVPELQVQVHSREGQHRLDLAWREAKVALEFDGEVKYFDSSQQPR